MGRKSRTWAPLSKDNNAHFARNMYDKKTIQIIVRLINLIVKDCAEKICSLNSTYSFALSNKMGLPIS